MEEYDRWYGCNKVWSILRWLDSLDIPIFYGLDSYCTCRNTRFPYGDIYVNEAIYKPGPGREMVALRKELGLKLDFNDYYKRKPVLMRDIAVLYAYDDQFLGNILAKLAWDNNNIDLSHTQSARTWFEDRIPHNNSSIPKLIFIFKTLVVAFYIQQNYRLGLPPLNSIPHTPPGGSSHSQAVASAVSKRSNPRTHQLDGNTTIITKRWLATIE